MMSIVEYQKKIQRSKGKLDSLQKRLEEIKNKQNTLQIRSVALEEAQAFIQIVAQETQSQLRFVIGDLVNLAMSVCFPDEYIFDISFEIKRGKTEAQLLFKKDNIEIDPISASGGGVVDVVAFALRLSAWSLGHTDNVIILDEPFRFLSKDLQPRAGEMMNKLCKSLGLQIICVTHSQEIIENSDRIFEVIINGGVSKVISKEA